MITNFGNGNPALANLPRKLNIGLSPSRDDFPHTHINDIGLKAVKDPATGEVCPSPCARECMCWHGSYRHGALWLCTWRAC